jgi:hypothetical protein
MPIPTYTPGYPPDGTSLGQTKATIRNNLDGTFQTVAVDHVNNNGQPGSQPAGYHTIVHEVTQTNVTTVTGYNQIFSGVPGTLVVNAVTTPTIPANSDTQLYALTGAGILAQLTGYSASGNGYAWSGGILIQWGSGSFSNGNSVPFPINFPNNCFQVICCPIRLFSLAALQVNVYVSSTAKTGWVVTTNQAPAGVAWVAIGN